MPFSLGETFESFRQFEERIADLEKLVTVEVWQSYYCQRTS